MTIKNKRVILIALLIGITLFSVFKFSVSIKEKYDLTKELNQIKAAMSGLQNEKQNLLQTLEKEKELKQKMEQEIAGLTDNLRLSQEKAAKLEQGLAEQQKSMEGLNSQISSLASEKEKLKLELAKINEERENLKTRLNSITELKKAIVELKKQARKVGREIKQKISKEKAGEGNQGFVVKDGKTTFPAKITIEVNPAPSK